MQNRTNTLALLILIFVALTSFSVSVGTENKKGKLDWTQLSSFRIYDYKTFPEGKNIYTVTDKEIEKMKFVETNLQETKNILLKAIPLGNTTYIWKGSGDFALAIFKDGQKRKIKISGYGGFFMDITSKEFFELKDEARNEWDKFRISYYKELYKEY